MAVETIRYALGSTDFASELIWDESKAARRPILLVAPNWFGVTPEWTGRARALAGCCGPERVSTLVLALSPACEAMSGGGRSKLIRTGRR